MLRRGALVLTCLVWASSAHAATYYIAVSGGLNSRSCATAQNIATPKQYFTAKDTGSPGGLSCLAPGDTLLARAGDYDEIIRNGIASGTSWTNKVRIANYNASVAGGGCSPNAPNACGTAGELVRIAGTTFAFGPAIWIYNVGVKYIEFDGIDIFDNAPSGVGGSFGVGEAGGTAYDHIRYQNAAFYMKPENEFGAVNMLAEGSFHEFINLAVDGGPCQAGTCSGSANCDDAGDNCGGYSIYFAVNDSLIERCTMTGASLYLVHMYNFFGAPQRNVIRNNRFHALHSSGGPSQRAPAAILSQGSNHQISNNVFYDIRNAISNNGNGIQMFGSGDSGVLIDNNTFADMPEAAILIVGSAASSTIRNNLAYSTQGFSNAGSGGGTSTCTNNLFPAVLGQSCANNQTDDPLWVNAASGNFHLSAGSSSIDTGVCLGNVPTDFDGVARPQGTGCDRGAFEYTATGTLPGIPASLSPVSGATNVPVFTALSFTSSNATAFDFYLSPYVGVGTASFSELFDVPNTTDIGTFWTPFTTGAYTNAQIVNQHVRNTSTTLESNERFTGGSLAADQWARMRLTTFGTGQIYAGFLLRCQSGAQPSGYFVGAQKGYGSGNTTLAYRYDNGAYTFLAAETATTWAASDFLEAHIVGNTLTIYRNGNDATAIRLTAQDPLASYSSGGVCLSLGSTTVGQLEVDNFEAGNIGPVFQGTQTTNSLALSGLDPATVYYWKPAGRNNTGVTEGTITSFTTEGVGSVATPVGIRVRFKAP